MLSCYIGEYETGPSFIDFESAQAVLMEVDRKIVVKRRFERLYNAKETSTYTKYEDNPENEELFNYGFKHIKTDKVDNYI